MIDWTRAWLAAVRPTAQRFGLADTALTPAEGQAEEAGQATGAQSNQALNNAAALAAFNIAARTLNLVNAGGLPLRFVPQSDLPAGQAYEDFIGATGCVPTRDNLHDFFNGLAWLAYPRIKRQLNAMQVAQIALAGIGKSRGPTRDGVTIFDENAALLVVRECEDGRELVELLRNHQWLDALFTHRYLYDENARLFLFGHALMEKLVAPRKAITAHTRVVWVADAFFTLGPEEQLAHIDAQVARELEQEGLDTRRFSPLPVLGVPGWWPGQDEAFYLDASVFRPKRGPSPS